MTTLLILVLLAGVTVLLVARGARLWACVPGLLALLPAVTLLQALSWPGLLVAGGLLMLMGWHRWSRSRATIPRWSARSRRRAGVASTLDIARHAGTTATRRTPGLVQGPLAGVPGRCAPRWEGCRAGSAWGCRPRRSGWSCAGSVCSGCGPRSRT